MSLRRQGENNIEIGCRHHPRQGLAVLDCEIGDSGSREGCQARRLAGNPFYVLLRNRPEAVVKIEVLILRITKYTTLVERCGSRVIVCMDTMCSVFSCQAVIINRALQCSERTLPQVARGIKKRSVYFKPSPALHQQTLSAAFTRIDLLSIPRKK